MNMDSIIKKIIDEKTPCVFISPHLDDAVLSAGELLAQLATKTKVTIITVFTEAALPPYTLSVKVFLKRCGGYKNAEDLFSLRRKEDIVACRALGVNYIHLGFQDASFRKRNKMTRLIRYFSKFVPEAAHVYPVYRFNIISGKISREDSDIMVEIEKKISLVAEKEGKCQVFCPLGIGNHIDHIIVRDICRKVFSDLVFWEDYSYSHKLKGEVNSESFVILGSSADYGIESQKTKAISSYRSQIHSMFPNGITLLPEKYYREKLK